MTIPTETENNILARSGANADAKPPPRVSESTSNVAVAAFGPSDKLATIKVAAERLEIPYWKLQRAAKRGLFPTFSLLNSRRLVRPTGYSRNHRVFSGGRSR
jgi:hypothetical protein